VSATTDSTGKFNYILGMKLHLINSPEKVGPLQGVDGKWRVGQKGDCRLIDVTLGMGYSFTEYLSANLSAAMLGDVMETTVEAAGSGATSYGLSDILLGVKFVPTKLGELLPSAYNIGIYSTLSLPTGEKRVLPPNRCATDTVFGEPCRLGEGGLHRFFTAGGATFGITLLFTYTTPTEPEVPIHLNLGYIRYPHSDICSKYIYGMGAKVNLMRYLPFLELYGERRVSSSYNDGGFYLTPGVEINLFKNVWFTLAIALRLSKELSSSVYNEEYCIQGGFGPAPPWRISFAFSQKFAFVKEYGW
jgi:hypothetical protein